MEIKERKQLLFTLGCRLANNKNVDDLDYDQLYEEYFKWAGIAMQGIVTGCGDSDGVVKYVPENVAEMAFDMADAMLEEAVRRL